MHLLSCGLFALLCVALIGAAGATHCDERASAVNHPPRVQCPVDASVGTSSAPTAACMGTHSWSFNYRPNPVVPSGVHRTTRNFLADGASTIPHGWTACVEDPLVPYTCVDPAQPSVNTVTAPIFAWTNVPTFSKWVSNTSPATVGAPNTVHLVKLSISKQRHIFPSGAIITHQSVADNQILGFRCESGAFLETTMPSPLSASFTGSALNPMPNLNEANCVGLQSSATTVVTYRLRNAGTVPNEVGYGITIRGDPILRENNPGFTDSCGAPTGSVVTSVGSGGNFNLGSTTVTLRATDNAPVATDCSFRVFVFDDVPPQPVCNAQTITLDAAGRASLDTLAFTTGSTDDCSNPTFDVSQVLFTCSHLGLNTVTNLGTDDAGNQERCTATVTVNDLGPNAVCVPAISVVLINGVATIQVSDVDNGSTDNCGVTSRSLSRSTFSFPDVAASPVAVTLTVGDQSGLTGTCITQVTVGGTLLQGSFNRLVAMYVPILFEWGDVPEYTFQDIVSFRYIDPLGNVVQMVDDISFVEQEYTYEGFHKALPDRDYRVRMYVNNIWTGEEVICSLIIGT